MSGDDYNGRFRAGVTKLSQSFKSIDTRKPHVEQDASIRAFTESLQTVFTGLDGIGDKAFVFHNSAKRVANAALIVNNEN